jgi:glucokinase
VAATIGVDIGGTKILGGLIDEGGQIVATARAATPAADPAVTLERIVEVVTKLAAERPVDAVGLAAAGWIDERRATVMFAPNLAWRNEHLRDKVAERVGLPVVVENDANAAAWAEFRYGAAREADDSMVMFTIGTGIGGGIVLGGSLVRGAHGVAAELGHVVVVPGGHPCGCGRRGCIEQYASGNALVRAARAGAERQPRTAAALLDLAGGRSEAITGPMVTTAARAGDAASLAAFTGVGTWLGSSLADMVQILDPQVLVVGGGVIDAGDLLMTPVREGYERALAQRGRLPVAEVRPALMGNAAGVIGAGDLARL